MLVSLNPDNKLRLVTFQDRANDETNPLPLVEANAAGNFQQDTFVNTAANEPTLGDIVLPSTVVVWKQGDHARHDGGRRIRQLLNYASGHADGSDRLPPDRGIAPPEDTVNSGLPTTSGGRGIYFADGSGRNFFRLTVDSDLSGRLRLDKYQGSGYVTSGWKWY